ncbi:UTRA domain-containing protein [Pseudorhodoferax sp.]|uniref:UTRA domain-containing protein n=1 Tax=Pseudorhodoferax sp. TaxID=1993553 RepID=UPI002DD61A00|nr:UTRA domain-containing protein [Pseudorhodoferax sp.]
MATYSDIQDWLRTGIREGRWRAGDRLPSEAELCLQFSVSRMTVNRALRELQHAGLVRREQGRGSFVAPLERVAARLELRDLHQDAAERGHHHEAEVLVLRAEAASADCAHALGLRRGQRVFFCQLLHREQGVPLQLESRWVLPSAAPAFLEQDFGRQTPTAYLLQVAPLTAAQYQIEAVAASPEEARCLGLEAGEPCLLVQRLSHGAAGPVSWARLLHRRYVLQGSFTA